MTSDFKKSDVLRVQLIYILLNDVMNFGFTIGQFCSLRAKIWINFITN